MDVVHRPIPGRSAETPRKRPRIESRALGHRRHRIGTYIVLRDPFLALADNGIGLLYAPRHGGEWQLAVQVAGEQVDLGGPERMVLAAQPRDEVKREIVPG